MTDSIFRIRRANLAAYIGPDRGAAAKLEEKYGVDASFLSQIKNGHRRMGEKAARKLEEDLGLPAGYFDREPGSLDSPATLEEITDALSRADWLPAEDREIVIGFLRRRAL